MKTALVTGASGGIGLELSRLLSRDGYRLVLVARSEDKLHQVAAELGNAIVLKADLADPGAPRMIFDRLQQDNIELDVLVNNAGYTVYGELHQADVQAELDMLQVNVMALTALTTLFLPGMRTRGRGRILNVASLAGMQPGPMWAPYAASKAYVISLSEAVSFEMRGSGVTVTVVCPGPTETGFMARGQAADSRLYKGRTVGSAVEAAAVGYRAMQKGQPLVLVGHRYTVLSFLQRFAPRRLVVWFLHQMQRRV